MFHTCIVRRREIVWVTQKKRNKKIAVVLTLAISLLSCAVYIFSVQSSALLAFTQLAIAVLIVITKIEIGGEKDE